MKQTTRSSGLPVTADGTGVIGHAGSVAVQMADGGEAIADVELLRHEGAVLGPVEPAPTVWRALDELTRPRSAGSKPPG